MQAKHSQNDFFTQGFFFADAFAKEHIGKLQEQVAKFAGYIDYFSQIDISDIGPDASGLQYQIKASAEAAKKIAEQYRALSDDLKLLSEGNELPLAKLANIQENVQKLPAKVMEIYGVFQIGRDNTDSLKVRVLQKMLKDAVSGNADNPLAEFQRAALALNTAGKPEAYRFNTAKDDLASKAVIRATPVPTAEGTMLDSVQRTINGFSDALKGIEGSLSAYQKLTDSGIISVQYNKLLLFSHTVDSLKAGNPLTIEDEQNLKGGAIALQILEDNKTEILDKKRYAPYNNDRAFLMELNLQKFLDKFAEYTSEEKEALENLVDSFEGKAKIMNSVLTAGVSNSKAAISTSSSTPTKSEFMADLEKLESSFDVVKRDLDEPKHDDVEEALAQSEALEPLFNRIKILEVIKKDDGPENYRKIHKRFRAFEKSLKEIPTIEQYRLDNFSTSLEKMSQYASQEVSLAG